MPLLCILCGKNLEEKIPLENQDKYQTKCSTCGIYLSNDESDGHITANYPFQKKALISIYARDLFENGFPPPDLNSLTDNEDDLARIISKYKHKSLIEKLNNLILYLAKHTTYFEEPITVFSANAYPLTFSPNEEEFKSLRDYGIKSGLFKMVYHGDLDTLALTWNGWHKYEEIKSNKVPSNICFIAMNIHDSLNNIYDNGIVPAIIETKHDPLRIDREEFNDDVFDLIISSINRCKFMIADFTNQRPNVYLEAGYARGLGKPVIHTCKRDQLGDTHFDVRQNNFICWDGPEDLKDKLINRIRATIKD